MLTLASPMYDLIMERVATVRWIRVLLVIHKRLLLICILLSPKFSPDFSQCIRRLLTTTLSKT